MYTHNCSVCFVQVPIWCVCVCESESVNLTSVDASCSMQQVWEQLTGKHYDVVWVTRGTNRAHY